MGDELRQDLTVVDGLDAAQVAAAAGQERSLRRHPEQRAGIPRGTTQVGAVGGAWVDPADGATRVADPDDEGGRDRPGGTPRSGAASGAGAFLMSIIRRLRSVKCWDRGRALADGGGVQVAHERTGTER